MRQDIYVKFAAALRRHEAANQEAVFTRIAERIEARLDTVKSAQAASQVAYGGTLDGGEIYSNLCAGCHTAGVAGAPMLTQADWASRIAQGNDVLYTHAIEGFTGSTGFMPARGGNPALSDEQVIASVDWMLENLQ